MHAGAATRRADDDQRQFAGRGPLDEPREPFADHAAHAPHDERGIGHAAGDAAGPDHAGACDNGIGHARSLLLGHDPLGVGLLVAEAEGVGRPQAGIPFLEGAVVEQLCDPLRCRHIPVEAALRADVLHLLRFLAVDRGAAALALLPEALGHAPLGPRRGWSLGRRGYNHTGIDLDGGSLRAGSIFRTRSRRSAAFHERVSSAGVECVCRASVSTRGGAR